jgi:serine/threonine protein phosphatase 1
MKSNVYKFLDLSDKRNIYAVGDIHGVFDQLRARLQEVDFDGNQDALISVGDLVDRGPMSHQAKDFAVQPWFHRVIGNHEVMMQDHLNGNSYLHTRNGGGWMADMSQEEKKKHVDILMDAPYMLEIKTPSNQRIGFVHADLPYKDWQENIDAPDLRYFCWSRTGLQRLSNPDYDPTVRGIDKVFYGHNALYNPISRGNCNWIDTGCGFNEGHLTIVNVETFGKIISE